MSREDCELCGVIAAMVSPATDDGLDIDEARARALARRLIDAGVHGLFLCGSTGEAPLLSTSQRQRLIEAVAAENNKQVPLLVGVGAMSTGQAIANAKDAEARGADYVAALPLHFVRVSENECESYFKAIADSVSIPTLLYNYPQLTSGQHIPASVAARLAGSHNVIGVKDSSGDLSLQLRYMEECGPAFAVFTGTDALLLSLLTHGGTGTICASANVIPEILIQMYDYFTTGETDEALMLQRKLVRAGALWQAGTFPAAVKAACAMRDTPAGPPFAPVHPLNEEQLAELQRGLSEVLDD